MDFTLITYGAGEVLSTTFNAIASLMNAKTGTLYQPLVRCALLLGLVIATFGMIYGDVTKFLTKWMMPALLILLLFFAPTCRLHIHDPVSGYRYSVDHVPWGLGAVAGVISKIGDTMTKEIEKVFSLPDDFKYHKTGAVMASNLIANARTFHITNSDLAETLQSFMSQCVVYDALLGKKYTLQDLKTSPDLWMLITANPSPARSFTFKAPGKGQKGQISPCNQVVPLLNQWLSKEVQNAFQFFESKVFGKWDPRESPALAALLPGAQLKQYLPGAFNYMTQMARSAEEVMMQQMMMYAVVDSIENTSTGLGNAPNFAIRRAYLQQRAQGETLAGVAAQKLIAMKNVIEALIYAGFIFILPLALLPMGWSFISRWIGLVLWVQLWPPLYAILNFIMNISVRAKGLGIVAGGGTEEPGITIANSVGFMNLHADMAAQAGFMSIAVGSLAYALVKGGASGFVHLASHLGGSSMQATTRATEDLISGNYSFGNVNQGAIQAYNTSFGQQNLSPTYASGAFTQNDGVISRTTGSEGSHIVSVSNSNLRSSLNFSESLSNSYSEQASQARQASQTQLVASAQAQADHNRQVMDFSSHQAKQTSGSDSYTIGNTATSNQAYTKLDALVDRFAKDHSISKERASQILARASASTSASVGIGLPLTGAGITAQVGGEIAGSLSRTETGRDLTSAAIDYTKQSNFQEALNQASTAARDSRHSELTDQGKRVVSSINDSYEKSHQYRDEASASLQKSEAFSQMASWTQQNAGSINASLNQAYIDWLQTQSLPLSSGPMGIREAETIVSSRPDLDARYQQQFMEEKMKDAEVLLGSHGLASSPSDITAAYEKTKGQIVKPVHQDLSQGTAAQSATVHGFGSDFNVNAAPREQAQQILDQTDTQMSDHQKTLQVQGDSRKEAIEMDHSRTDHSQTDQSESTFYLTNPSTYYEYAGLPEQSQSSPQPSASPSNPMMENQQPQARSEQQALSFQAEVTTIDTAPGHPNVTLPSDSNPSSPNLAQEDVRSQEQPQHQISPHFSMPGTIQKMESQQPHMMSQQQILSSHTNSEIAAAQDHANVTFPSQHTFPHPNLSQEDGRAKEHILPKSSDPATHQTAGEHQAISPQADFRKGEGASSHPKVSIPSQRDLKEKLSSIEDILHTQQEALEKQNVAATNLSNPTKGGKK